jgi:glycosyltransferase involved in cell wall biosynthesis
MAEYQKIAHSVSFVVLALNEQKVVEQVVREIHSTVDGLINTYEIILIDDGSTDRTGEIMEMLARELTNTRVLHNSPNCGLGGSYKRGVGESKYDYVMMLCGDGGIPASSLPAIVSKIGTVDIVIPYVTNLREIKTLPRYLLSRSYTQLLNFLSGQKLNYYNGLPVHRRSLLSPSVMTSSGFGIQGEILVRLLKSGHSFVEVGVPGGETTNKSSIFRPRNLVSVSRTVWKIIKLVVVLGLYQGKNGRERDLHGSSASLNK